jgi:N-methylhydantoinase B
MEYDPITLEILWSRLISIVDEMATTLVRTAFSPMVREAHDMSCVLLDPLGNSMAQSSRSIPSFAGMLPIITRNFLEVYPPHTLKSGDIIVTNDPWLGASHLPDLAMVTPVFHQGELAAFVGTIAHLPDIGGKYMSGDAREIYEEGLRIPISKLYKEGHANEDIFNMVRHNVRVPEQVVGDIMAQVTANRVGSKILLKLMEDEKIADLRPLARAIQDSSERAMRAAIQQIPDGDYHYELYGDGFDVPIVIKVRVSIRGSEILVDYTGTSPQSERSINSVWNYTYAYTTYAIKCAFSPATPNNEGCFRPIKVLAPEGTLVNPRLPAAVGARHFVGLVLPSTVFGALAQVAPDKILADGGTPPWLLIFSGWRNGGERFSLTTAISGGQGAGHGWDGLSCLMFPTNSDNTPVEIIEHLAPILVGKKKLIEDSGGAGQFRGGCGQEMTVQSLSDLPIRVTLFADKIKTQARGLEGGESGASGSLKLNEQVVEDPKGRAVLHHGDCLEFRLPGGGGFGPPSQRDRKRLLHDVRRGLVSVEQARDKYGLKVEPPLGEDNS